jgi:hypothetical protein
VCEAATNSGPSLSLLRAAGPSGAPYNQIRTEISLKVGAIVSQARLFVTGVGYYRAFVNGMKLGRATVLDPAWYAVRSRRAKPHVDESTYNCLSYC